MDKSKIEHVLMRGVEDVIDRKHLEQALAGGKTLRVKLGIDPTASDLHLGHAVVLRKLKEFQELGHKIILIIGDFTARIGDPAHRAEARKPLTESEIKKNMEKYLRQAGKIVNLKKAEVFYNSRWFLKEGMAKMIELSSAASIQQVLHREDFKERINRHQDITLTELLYPLLQGYDSLQVKADLELGGTDQTFNLLMGRRVQRCFGMKEQDILTVSLLEGLDGVKKMSKSLDNFIALDDEGAQMFGKIMSLPDKLISKYFLLTTDLEETEIKTLEKSLSPRDLKARLGFEIVKIYHGEKAAEKAKGDFDSIFVKKEIPEDIPDIKVNNGRISSLDLVVLSGVVASKSEARRLIEQGGLEVQGRVFRNSQEVMNLKGGEAVKIGKRHFFRIRV
ncbi:MAG: tyrosine--tRNA ligase [Candidatus Liptonbacteria bacterium]|nr:tyrosine--tRNA ligase [Candidatus Liptonbacteria bacterium]